MVKNLVSFKSSAMTFGNILQHIIISTVSGDDREALFFIPASL